MAEISYRRHRFPPVIIQPAVWLYLRFTLSCRDVEELLAKRGLDISYENSPVLGAEIRTGNRATATPTPSAAGNRWHLDESAPRTHDQQWECGAA